MDTNHVHYFISSQHILQKLEARVFKVWNDMEQFDI